ncbi:hypothetical protein RJ641_021960 [Dillenia turbinata]|uniref:Uncharacterized protein n=1 Tax=Dillenia turbinata TaxID=194707 RepID=A0AAN8YR97_9MAGN
MVKASIGQRWWEAPVEELSVQELEQLNASLQELKKRINGCDLPSASGVQADQVKGGIPSHQHS